ncbi:MAG: anti-sigma factor [Anaerolineae bacterium]
MSLEHSRMTSDNCDSIQELIPEYAFGLTDAEQTQLIESSLRDCPDAAAQLADYRQIQAVMRDSVPQIEPPAALEDRLMAAIAQPAAPPAPRKRQITRSWWVAAAALVALVLTNVYWLARVSNSVPQPDTGQVTVSDSGAFVLTSTANLRWARLPATETVNPDATAFLMWNRESKIGLMYARGFPEPDTGKTYQLWLTRGEIRVSVGTFQVNEEGIGSLLFHSEQPIDEFTWARITAEPYSGSQQPSENIVVIGQL